MRILLEIPTWLGDAVMTTPAIENLVGYFPNCRLVIFGSKVSTTIFKNHPNLERIIIDNSRDGFRYKNIFLLAKEVGDVDIAISFRKNFTTKLFLFFIKAKNKYIYKRYDKSFGTHQVIRYNDFINHTLNLQTTPDKLKIYLKSKIDKNHIKPILGINPGATYGSAKRWYPKEFANVCIALSKRYDIKIFGGPNEKDIANDIESILKENRVDNYTNLAGKTTIDELIHEIASLDLFITNDSGPMHVAAAFGIPTVAIFGPTRYKETSQWKNTTSILLRKELECSPCMKRVCPLKHHNCMKLITAQDVLEVLKKENLA